MKTDLEIQKAFQDAGKAIVLIGFMASGKTAIGNALGGILGSELVDSDKAIVQRSRKESVGQIFEEFGQAHFRDLERKFIQKALQAQKSIILSTGGGAFMNDETRQLILDHANPIWLQASAETIFKRSQADLKRDPIGGLRPLIHIKEVNGKHIKTTVAERKALIADILQQREGIYSQCETQVNTEDKEPEEIAYEIVKKLGFVPNPS